MQDAVARLSIHLPPRDRRAAPEPSALPAQTLSHPRPRRRRVQANFPHALSGALRDRPCQPQRPPVAALQTLATASLVARENTSCAAPAS